MSGFPTLSRAPVAASPRGDALERLSAPAVPLRLRRELAARGGGTRGLAHLARDLRIAPLDLLRLIHGESDPSVPLSMIPGLSEVA